MPGLARGVLLAVLFATLAGAPVLAGDSVSAAGPLPDGRLITVSPLELARIGILLTPPVDARAPAWIGLATRAGVPTAFGSLFVERRPAIPGTSAAAATRIAAGSRLQANPIETELVYASTRDTLTPCPKWRRNCTVQVSDRQLCWAVVLATSRGSREIVLVDARNSGVIFSAPLDS